ncbi:aminopeptidase [Anaerosphaera aminiphila DSM 21120]|uniref:Aminopeptidase n=1 Tax=Anaerosphaera aminiphila DSM 21120 TaxID=1120995 RepID=A0A1M5P1P0_9FIRM|nr:aminopeptidase [Anaerosphaera aminiphila]SHG95754.1 aminopeptidase [Anaerosphaera aminiphila DSM 21120]
MSFLDNLNKYANLIIKKGLNIKSNDILIIRGEVENYKFINIVAETAYKFGAKDVKVNYRNQELSKIRYDNATIETLTDIPKHFVDEQNYYMDKKAKILSIVGDDPNILSSVNPDKINASVIASSKALKDVNAKLMNNEVSWCVVGAATKSWAKVVFPNLDEEEALKKLWDMIFYTVRLSDDNPSKSWDIHVESLKNWSNFLNKQQFKSFHYSSTNGTNLTVGMPENYIFAGASEYNRYNEEFIANMPTEEVFSMPHRNKVNGIVYNTKPLNYNGNIIDNFYLKFQDGVVIDFNAKKGYETLKNLLNTDDGSKRLGEIALVPYKSPISDTNILFFNTLYDENASCHFALGKAYPTCIVGGESMSEKELLENGANDSLVHVDFMVGDETTNIIGVTKDNREIEIFKNGNFSI